MNEVNLNLKKALILFKQQNYLKAKVAFLEIIEESTVDPKVYFILYEIFNKLNVYNYKYH